MKEAQRLIQSQLYPAQHLWGLWNLSDNWRASVTDICLNHVGEKHRLLRLIIGQVERLVGDPIQAAWALTGVNSGSLVYAANPKTGTLIGLLKRLRLVRIPYVVLVHSYPISRWAKWCLEPADAVLVFSDRIKQLMELDGVPPTTITVAGWGPDLSWTQYDVGLAEVQADFIAAGKTNRDYKSLRKLAGSGQLDGYILDGDVAAAFRQGELTESAGRPSYPEVMALMAKSQVVIIPLLDPSMLSGLTEFSDALALGRPVVMTRNDWMPLDIETLGIGVWLDSHDPVSVHAAVKKAAAIPQEQVLEVARWFNMQTFSKTLEKVLDEVWTRTRSENHNSENQNA
ncbi:glycosyltransferase [Paenarthrobacter aurescens]|nr:glycosyltransferase [Paenarthrobacter aurescens]